MEAPAYVRTARYAPGRKEMGSDESGDVEGDGELLGKLSQKWTELAT